MKKTDPLIKRIDRALATLAEAMQLHSCYGAMVIFDRLEDEKKKLLERDTKLQEAIDRVKK